MDYVSRLVEALRCPPGVGPKSAQRMVYYLLQHQRQRGSHLAHCLAEAMDKVVRCQRCNNFSSSPCCDLCLKTNREPGLLCVVEGPADVAAIEQSGAYQGLYFVLMGKISPLDGVGPEDIGLDRLTERVVQDDVHEVILALSPTVEGQTTVHFVRERLSPYPLRISQLAHGIPSGGELEFLDSHTIGSALKNRVDQ